MFDLSEDAGGELTRVGLDPLLEEADLLIGRGHLNAHHQHETMQPLRSQFTSSFLIGSG